MSGTGLDWHFITGSKGGIGKTLLSLMLLAYFSTEYDEEEGSVLILDLNSMNTDTSALLMCGNPSSEVRKIAGSNSRTIILRKISFRSEKRNKDYHFVLGYPANPFQVFSNNEIVELISLIGEEAKKVGEEFNITPFSRVLVDTNYHFCNIFPDNDDAYAPYKQENLTGNQYTIWFLWVYRQLAKLLEHDSINETLSEEKIFNSTVDAIERVFKPKSKFEIGPIVHVYTPVSMLPSDADHDILRTFFPMFSTKKSDISGLCSLEDIKDRGNYVDYKTLKAKLSIASNAPKSSGKDKTNKRDIFDKILREAVEGIEHEKLPINIFPISTFEPGLQSYTDKERSDPINFLMGLEIYRKFKKVLNSKYGRSRG